MASDLVERVGKLAAHFEAACFVGDAYMIEENAADAKLLRDAAARIAALEEALRQLADIAERNYGRQNEKLSDIAPIARAALGDAS